MNDMSSTTKLQAIYRLSNLADAGADHPEAISYGPGRDYFDHRMILSAISSNHAEALRLHREFVEDEVISAPRQTSRRQPDGSRRSLQVQRVSANRLMAKLRKMSGNRPMRYLEEQHRRELATRAESNRKPKREAAAGGGQQ
jgi:hypothetical protein